MLWCEHRTSEYTQLFHSYCNPMLTLENVIFCAQNICLCIFQYYTEQCIERVCFSFRYKYFIVLLVLLLLLLDDSVAIIAVAAVVVVFDGVATTWHNAVRLPPRVHHSIPFTSVLTN